MSVEKQKALTLSLTARLLPRQNAANYLWIIVLMFGFAGWEVVATIWASAKFEFTRLLKRPRSFPNLNSAASVPIPHSSQFRELAMRISARLFHCSSKRFHRRQQEPV